ncbi:hypothetical protein QL285_046362 [Trifolium repens]|nr:hypothetical protein QL285_046362 [Trifolium repens]
MNQNQIQKSYKGYLERPQIRIFFSARIQNTFLGFEDSSKALRTVEKKKSRFRFLKWSYKKWKVGNLGRSDGGEGLGFGMETVERLEIDDGDRREFQNSKPKNKVFTSLLIFYAACYKIN